MNRSITLCLALAGSALLAGCKEDLAPATSRFEEFSTTCQQRLDALRTDGAEQERLLAALIKTPGLDPSAPASQGAASLWISAANDKQGLEVVAAALTRNRALVARSMNTGKAVGVNLAINQAQSEMTSLLDTVTEAAQVRRMEIKDLAIAVANELKDRARAPGALLEQAPADVPVTG